MEEGANQANQTKTETTKGNPVNINSTIGKTLQTCEAERSEEGGAIMMDLADRTTPPNVDIVANLASTRQSVAKTRVSQPF